MSQIYTYMIYINEKTEIITYQTICENIQSVVGEIYKVGAKVVFVAEICHQEVISPKHKDWHFKRIAKIGTLSTELSWWFW